MKADSSQAVPGGRGGSATRRSGTSGPSPGSPRSAAPGCRIQQRRPRRPSSHRLREDARRLLHDGLQNGRAGGSESRQGQPIDEDETEPGRPARCEELPGAQGRSHTRSALRHTDPRDAMGRDRRSRTCEGIRPPASGHSKGCIYRGACPAHLRRHRSDRPVFRREPSRARQARPGRPARFRISETPGYARPGTAIRSAGAVQRPVPYYLHENPKGGGCSAERLDTNPGRPRYLPRSRGKGSRRAPGSYFRKVADRHEPGAGLAGQPSPLRRPGHGRPGSWHRGSPAFNQWMMAPQGFWTPEGDAPASRGRRAASSSSNAVIGASQRCPSQT